MLKLPDLLNVGEYQRKTIRGKNILLLPEYVQKPIQDAILINYNYNCPLICRRARSKLNITLQKTTMKFIKQYLLELYSISCLDQLTSKDNKTPHFIYIAMKKQNIKVVQCRTRVPAESILTHCIKMTKDSHILFQSPTIP